MLRPISPPDTDAILALTADTGFFKPHEIETLREVIADFFEENATLGHRSFLWEESGRTLGFIYYAQAEMTDRTWYLYWIAVGREQQGRGLGGKLLQFVEQDVRDQKGRLLLIETSSISHYELTRKFYFKHGYTLAADIPDFYADGDGLIVFSKRLLPAAT
jgi:ribosomal protein S18 acetylase RimI-like enzyme